MSRFNTFITPLDATLNNITPQGQAVLESASVNALIDINTGKLKTEYTNDLSISTVIVVADIAERDLLIDQQIGDSVKVLSTGEYFIWDGSGWLLILEQRTYDSLTDVVISTTNPGDIVQWNGAIWSNSSQVHDHIIDSSIHYTEASINHNNLLNVGTNSHSNIDSHISDTTKHFTEASINHNNILNIGTTSHANIDLHIADTSIHYTEASIDHNNLLNVGTNSHGTIDSHLADTSKHFLNPLTTAGDLWTFAGRLPRGTNRQILKANATDIAWSDQYPLTTKGDLLVYTTQANRFGAGTLNQVLMSDSTTAEGLKWADITSSSLGGTAAIFKQKTLNNFEFRGLTAGANITLTQNVNDITIASTGGGGFSATADPVLIGLSATCTQTGSTCIGYLCSSTGNLSNVIGSDCSINNSISSFCAGYQSRVGSISSGNNYDMALGYRCLCDGNECLSLGSTCKSSRFSMAIGNSAHATHSDLGNNGYNLSIGNSCGSGFGYTYAHKYNVLLGNNIFWFNSASAIAHHNIWIGSDIHWFANSPGAINNSICLNASGNQMNSIVSSKVYINPMGASAGTYTMKYNTTTYEVSYDTGTSSRRCKRDIVNVYSNQKILDDFARIQIVDFKYINDEDTVSRRGVISEDFSKLQSFNSCLNTIEKLEMGNQVFEDVLAVNYEKLNITTILAIQQLNALIIEQKKQIEELQKTIETQEITNKITTSRLHDIEKIIFKCNM